MNIKRIFISDYIFYSMFAIFINLISVIDMVRIVSSNSMGIVEFFRIASFTIVFLYMVIYIIINRLVLEYAIFALVFLILIAFSALMNIEIIEIISNFMSYLFGKSFVALFFAREITKFDNVWY